MPHMEAEMVTIEQIKNGLTRYIDSEILPNLTGGKRFAMGVCAALMVQNLETTVLQYRENPAVAALGILDDGNNVDIDKLYAAATDTLRRMEKLSVDVPMMGVLTFRQNDLDTLLAMMKEGKA